MMRIRTLAGAALLALVSPLSAQQSIGVGASYLGYSFDAGLGVEAAQLFMVPVAVRLPVGDALTLDLYAAWAEGKVEQGNVAFTLSGPVDTRIKASYQATPWALVSVGVSLPTGNATHTSEEAVVSAVLATDLLGFREASWGTGFSMTSSVATAFRAGSLGVGVAGAYSVRGEFEPSSELDLTYQPGNETRIRVGVDRNFGNSTFTAGGTFMTYSTDLGNSRNLFQAGNRLRFDATYAFRAGRGVWTLYAADLWRERGDLTLDLADDAGNIVGDTTFTTASQNLIIAGFVGSVGLGSYLFRPQVDFKYQDRNEPTGNDEGSGWLVAAGGDFPVRIFGAYDVFPKARVIFGAIKDPSGTAQSLFGGEFSATIRWSF